MLEINDVEAPVIGPFQAEDFPALENVDAVRQDFWKLHAMLSRQILYLLERPAEIGRERLGGDFVGLPPLERCAKPEVEALTYPHQKLRVAKRHVEPMPAQDLQRVVTEIKGGGFRFGHGRLSWLLPIALLKRLIVKSFHLCAV